MIDESIVMPYEIRDSRDLLYTSLYLTSGKRSGDVPASFSSFYKRSGGGGGDKEEVLVPFSSFYGKRSNTNVGVPNSFSSFYKVRTEHFVIKNAHLGMVDNQSTAHRPTFC